MPTPDDVLPFRGDLTPEESAAWIKALVSATGSFSDAGVFRLISTKVEHGSVAREWFDELDDSVKTSWPAFERHFHDQWIGGPLIEAQKRAKLEEFCSHKLTYEMVFPHDNPDPELCGAIVEDWAEVHLALGQATDLDTFELSQRTELLLPAFIQAYLQVYTLSSSMPFNQLCTSIKNIPPEMYQLEWLRYQKSSNDGHSLAAQVREMSEKIDSIMAVLGCSAHDNHPAFPQQSLGLPELSDEKSGGSVAWEVCSPLTSVISVEPRTRGVNSTITTPTATKPSILEIVQVIENEEAIIGSAHHEDDLSNVPELWRKPATSLSKTDQIAIVEQAMEFILKFGNTISKNQASSLYSAMAIYDKILEHKNDNRWSNTPSSPDNRGEPLWLLIKMTYCYLADEHPLTILECKEKWNSISEMDKRSVDSPIPCVIHLKQTYVERRDHSSLQVKLHLKPSGEPTVAGGVYLLEQWPSKIAVRSDITVMFMMVSSYLAECTNDPEFLEYAVHSAICVRDHFMDSQTSLVKDCMVDAQDPQEQPKGDLSCHLTGIAIEGFSVLATVSGDDIWRKLAVEMAMSAMNFSKWHGPDGILAVGSEYKPSISNDVTAFKGLLCRGLLAAYQRNPTDKPFCNLVRGYINVQCNALLELSSRGDSYGVDWRGPYVGPYPHGQLAALDAFIAGVGVNN